MKINRTLIKSANWMFAALITLLGFVGCEKEKEQSYGIEEYGVPHVNYTVKGAVVSKVTGKPVKGIRVSYYGPYVAIPMYGVIPAPYEPKTSVLTDAKGEFKLTDSFFSFSEEFPTLPVYVEDIDGKENGLFQSETLQVDFKKAEHSGKSGNWYMGEYTVTLNDNVELTGIENE